MKCTRIGEKRCNWSCFEIDQEMDAILLIIGIAYWVCRIVIKSVQQCTYFLFSVNLLLVGVNYGQRNYLYLKGLLYIWEMIMMALLHMVGLENSECIWKIQRKPKWLYPFQWLKSRKCDVRWIFLSNSSEGGSVGIFKYGSRKEIYLGGVTI